MSTIMTNKITHNNKTHQLPQVPKSNLQKPKRKLNMKKLLKSIKYHYTKGYSNMVWLGMQKVQDSPFSYLSPFQKINQGTPQYQFPSSPFKTHPRPNRDTFKTQEKMCWKSIRHGSVCPIPSFKKIKIKKIKAKESSPSPKTQNSYQSDISFKTWRSNLNPLYSPRKVMVQLFTPSNKKEISLSWLCLIVSLQ